MEKGTPYNEQHSDKADLARVAAREQNQGSGQLDFEDSTAARAFLDRKPGIEEAARDIVEGSRQDEYGGPEDSFTYIARLWNAHLQNRGADITLSPGDVALMMDLMKTARLITAPGHRDSLVDKIGYVISYAKAMGVDE